MAFTQIAGIAPNFRDYKNDWLKAYEPGTTTPKVMADNDTGTPTVAKYEINNDGFPVSSGGTIVIPHIDGDYDLWLFPTEAEADANDTSNAERVADDATLYLTQSSVADAIGGVVSYEFDTKQNAKDGDTIGGDSVSFSSGDVIRIKELGNTLFDVVSGVTLQNDRTIIADTSGLFSFVQRTFEQTYSEFTWYVDPILGTDAIGYGVSSGANAFKTIQYAWDQLPTILNHQQTIQLGDGIYNTNYIASADQPRPAILWGKGKITTFRSTRDTSNNEITGAVVIKGNNASRSSTVIKTGSDFTYGIYINKGNVGIQDIEIQSDAVTKASGLLVSHRTDTYIHCTNVLIDGKDVAGSKFASNGVIAESGGQVELSDECVVKNADVGCVTLTDGDNITVSGSTEINSCETGATILAGFLKMFMSANVASNEMIHSCTTAIRGVFGQIEVRGSSSTNRAVIESPMLMEGSYLNLVNADTLELVQLSNGSSVKYDSSNFQRQLQLKASTAYLRNSDSYVSPATANTDTIPVGILYGSTVEYEGTNNITGASGGPASYNPRDLDFTADSQIVAIEDDTDIYRIDGNGANRLTCEIDSTGVPDGRTIHIDGDTSGVEFTSGTNMDIPTNFSVGGNTGQYSGATLTMRGGLWRVTGLGQIRP